MLHHTYILPVRIPLSFLRWFPFFVLAGYAGAMVPLDRSRLRRSYWFDLFILAFLGLAITSGVYSIEPSITVARAESLALVYVALFWGLWAAVDRIGSAAMINSLVNAGTVVFVLLYLTLPYLNFEHATLGNRLRSFLENANTVGLLVAFLLPFVFLKSVESRQLGWHAVTALLLVSLVLSQSRTGLGAALLGSGYFLYHAVPNQRRLVAVCAVVFVALNVGWSQIVFGRGTSSVPSMPLEVTLHAEETTPLSLDPSLPLSAPVRLGQPEKRATEGETSPEPIWERLLDWRSNRRNLDWASLGGRLPVWRAGLAYLSERPWLGYGFGTEEFIMKLHGFNEASYGNRFHSAFLGLALQVGIVGAIIFYMPVLVLAWMELRNGCLYSEMPERFALRAILIVGLVTACFESSMYALGSSFAFSFWASVMLLGRITINDRVVDRPRRRLRCRFSLERDHVRVEIGWRHVDESSRLEARALAFDGTAREHLNGGWFTRPLRVRIHPLT
jgi:hypothetical protein